MFHLQESQLMSEDTPEHVTGTPDCERDDAAKPTLTTSSGEVAR